MICPNKNTIYHEYLPNIILPASKRFITDLVIKLEKYGVLVYDPTQKLLYSKNKGLLYSRSDSHWNLLGGSVAFEGLLDKIRLGGRLYPNIHCVLVPLIKEI